MGWDVGEYGRTRDTDLPWPADLGALALDPEASEIMDKLIDEVLNLNSASDVRVHEFYLCELCDRVRVPCCK